MGQHILEIANQDAKLNVTGGLGKGSLAGAKVLKSFPAKSGSIDVVIDFTLPTFFSKTLSWCVKNQLPLVSGTTGLSNKQFADIKKASQKIPILWAPNMSLGVAVANEMVKCFKYFSDADFQIEEFHHNKKLDKPSGTAKFLQTTLRKSVEKKLPQPLAIRGGGIYGIHKVYGMTDEEIVMVEHSALNRAVFARGAITAAKWLRNQEPGEYTISNVLGL